jgi:hypothetical protein
LPLGQIALDFAQGGLDDWFDPNNALVSPGTCSNGTVCIDDTDCPTGITCVGGFCDVSDRGCVRDADCHFCTQETEPSPSTRAKACSSGCDNEIPLNVCNQDATCEGLGLGAIQKFGNLAAPQSKADLLIILDFSFWVSGSNDPALLMQPGTTIIPSSPWDPVTGCTPDFATDNNFCDYPVSVDPGELGTSSGPPGKIEFAIPFADLPGFNAGDDYRFQVLVSRGATSAFNFAPVLGIEDVMSEDVGLATTTAFNSCPGFGTETVACELADGSADAFVPNTTLTFDPGGRVSMLLVNKAAGTDIQLDWEPSCSAADNFYGVYEGTLASLPVYDHSPVTSPSLCSVAGTTATFAPASGNRYYLISPNDDTFEGSYGESSTSERPQGFSPCETIQLLACP